MTKDFYKSIGYNVSANIEQAIIDRSERDAMSAYVSRILPDVDVDTDEDVQHCLADIAYLLLLQRTLKVTRSGTKEKTSAQSVNAGEWAALCEQVQTAAYAIEKLRKMDGAIADAKVTDIAKIYFQTHFYC